jgi:hypothetical protein
VAVPVHLYLCLGAWCGDHGARRALIAPYLPSAIGRETGLHVG